MSKLTFDSDTFKCHLRCDQCIFIKANGQRCRNRVCIGYPVCWVHTKQEYGVRVKDSTVEGAGKGLFAHVAKRRFEWICPYNGEMITQNCLDARYPGDVTAPYATQLDVPFAMGGGDYEDGACVRGVGSMANGLFDVDNTSLPLAAHNATIDQRPGYPGLWLRAWRNIPQGGEIFVWYGDDYRLNDDHTTKRRVGQDTRPC